MLFMGYFQNKLKIRLRLDDEVLADEIFLLAENNETVLQNIWNIYRRNIQLKN